MKFQTLSLIGSACLLTAMAEQSGAIDLLERYPTSLTAGDLSLERAREWEFNTSDIFRLSRFEFGWDSSGEGFKIETGPANLGVGHCADGAVWAVVIPQASGSVSWLATNRQTIDRIWLRFHPRDVNSLFPPETVFAELATNLAPQIRSIAETNVFSSLHVGKRLFIPEPNEFLLDVDMKNGLRRKFWLHPEKRQTAFTPELAADAFDQLWKAFDRSYAMFGLRPEVDWNRAREQFRPRALASQSAYELAEVCAEMLSPLRDLHVSLKVGGTNMPVFDRPRAINSNPSAHRTLLGDLHGKPPVYWTVTPDKIGYITTFNWLSSDGIREQCDEALDAVSDTRALIVDVRLNRGGDEDVARDFAGRFLSSEFIYASHRLRNGPAHTNLTEKLLRTVKPRGPWRYDRPVLLLIGQRCISSNESFVGMMTGATNVTTMGDRTAGSSGNPMEIKLPLDITVGMPVWISYLPDGTPLDERGFQPQIQFESQPGAFEGDRDDLLAAALRRLRQQ